MKKEKIEAAIAEAKRFIERANALLAAQKSADDEYSWTHPKESGATRRSSLELTRSLAEMRRPA